MVSRVRNEHGRYVGIVYYNVNVTFPRDVASINEAAIDIPRRSALFAVPSTRRVRAGNNKNTARAVTARIFRFNI